jgi:murein DD-endopeptidase MepM/ murein hydrolase activator NlpD
MNVVVFSKRWASARHYELSHPVAVLMLALAILMLLGGAFLLGTRWAAPRATSFSGVENYRIGTAVTPASMTPPMTDQVADQVADLAARVGQVNAQMLRLNALGKRLTELAHLDKGEFNFDAPPAQGGPELMADVDATQAAGQVDAQADELHDVLGRLESQLLDRERQLVILETFLSARQLTTLAEPKGSPVPGAWMSSGFGHRVDPFTGASAFHSGVDFAAAIGARVQAVAPGVITFAGEKSGYGQVVEINHGNGYITRYAHNSRLLVKVGDRVAKGSVVSQVGSSGRSTGPHLHFEVLKNGQQINPAGFISG